MILLMRSIQSHEVAAAFESYPQSMRAKLFVLRELIFDVAANTPGVGALEESLKWGEPAYATTASKSGSTVRIAWKRARPAQYAMYFNCQTALVDSFKTMFPTAFKFEGNRALVFAENDEVPVEALRICIEMALTYHAKSNAISHAKSGAKKREKI
jgi:Domain of unknown function (DU1801)